MKVTYILKNLTDTFYNGGFGIPSFLDMPDSEKFERLNALRHDMKDNIKQKIETGQFRDAVELNSLMKKPHTVEFKLEPRKGYKLATFTIRGGVIMSEFPVYLNPQERFEKAIAAGRLSDDPKSPRYAGNYMYMGEASAGGAMFKNVATREYLPTMAI